MTETELSPQGMPPPRRRRRGVGLLAGLLLLGLLAGLALLVLTGRPIALPVWAVAEVEQRLNRSLSAGASGAAVSLGGIEVTFGRDGVPRLRLEDIRLLQPGGRSLLTLPEARVAFDAGALSTLRLRAQSVVLAGAHVALRRRADGSLDLALGNAEDAGLDSYAAVMAAADRIFALPALSHLDVIEAGALTLRLDDARAKRVWEVGDGRLRLENRPGELALELGLTLLGQGADAPAQALLTFVRAKGSPETRLTATVDRVPAADLAAQVLPIAFLGVLDAPISGRLAAALDGAGSLTTLEATLDIAAGALRPTPETRPVAFERAGLSLRYDPAARRVNMTDLTVQSTSLRLAASGHAYLPVPGQPPAFLAQIRFADMRVDPEGLFERPVAFSEGALDLRIRLNPFSIDIGQLSLVEGGQHLTGKGRMVADPLGWRASLDVELDEIAHDRLLALWPVALVPRTREWLAENVQQGQLFDVKAALRMEPGAEPRLSLGYEFQDADVRFLKTLPPIEGGTGYATVADTRYTLVLDKGHVTPPAGGAIDVGGSVFAVPDITQRPSRAELRLTTRSSLTAALSLLDQPPFSFLTKAGQPVDLGEGRAELLAVLRLPLVARLLLPEVDYSVTGRILDLRSEVLVPGRVLTAPELALAVDVTGLRLSGPGLLGNVPFDVTYAQGFGPRARGRSRIDGIVTLSPDVVDEFNLGLPEGMVTGTAPAQIGIALEQGQPPQLTLVSVLNGLGLGIPGIGWQKPRDAAGRLELTARLGPVPQIDALRLEGGGLEATGNVRLREGGGLEAAVFDRVRLNGWLDAPVTLTGRGQGQPPAVALNGGTVDLPRLNLGAGGGRGGDTGPLDLALDRLRVTDTISLTGLRGQFSMRGGFNGTFTAQVDGKAAVQGTVVPQAAGTAVRIRSADAGGALAAAGIFPNARGGTLDLQLAPAGTRGHYVGRADITDVRLRRVPVLAELINAISVVGLIEQLNGSGLLFAQADAEFRLTPDAVEITRASATGASLGVSLAGLYRVADKRLDMQGVISPIYLLNGIGSIFTRRGEGLFGFNYAIGGTADDPQVSVNPLSILTPGMFRDIFRSAPPVLENQ
ncbi:hypothetical protein GEU84_001740 [Fertoebacter nigrum]|uniref:AsmA-like C-terminal domain-containing protein n=1 Tax=Fertoeibacter niger TaxID=2656921 RepID=A0A8X8GU13_9RHOB|nr:DUF3971 domain-containing protein [Fertoeibacter niger]NUB43092.1 hypothetical protein [Fertoeibacter niger]